MAIPDTITDANVNAWSRASRSPFPHMSPHDTEVWRAFLSVAPGGVTDVMYDVALGGAASRHVRRDDDLLEMWETLLKKRVDAVAVVGGEVWCVEVKPTGSMAALGQALTYAFLWNQEGRSKRKARAVVVCARVDEDLEPVLIAYGVLCVVVSPAQDGRPPQLVKVLGPLRV